MEGGKNYPSITWAQFDVCNDDATGAFEDMTRRLFYYEFLKESQIPHSDPNNPGIEVLPVLEPPHADGSMQRRISFQSKYFGTTVKYVNIKESALQTIKHYRGNLDCIYLFCNKTITTTSKGYKEIERLLSDAGIELYTISDKELLDLVAKYRDIADYFFLSRRRHGDIVFEQLPTRIIMYDEDNLPKDVSCCCNKSAMEVSPRLLQSLVQEKIDLCRSYILEMRFDKLKTELNKVFAYEIDNVEGAEKLYYYKVLIGVHDGEAIDEYIDKLPDDMRKEGEWLSIYYNKPRSLSLYAFAEHTLEVQVLVIDKMFSAQLWDAVVEICRNIYEDIDSGARDSVRLYQGLALFNLQDYDQAFEVLDNLYLQSQEDKVLLYSIFAEIQKINVDFRNGKFTLRQRLVELIEKLENLKENKNYKENRLLAELLYLETIYNLGMDEKKYLERAIEKFSMYEDSLKNNPFILFLYGSCLELNGNLDKAEAIYSSLDWRKEKAFAIRYMICKLSQGLNEDVIEAYGEIHDSIKDVMLDSIYLTALYYTSSESQYKEELQMAIESQCGNLSGIIAIAFGIRDKGLIRDLIIPKLKGLIEADVIDQLSLQEKVEMLSFLSLGGNIDYIEVILRSMNDLRRINRYVIHEIYITLIKICSEEYKKHNDMETTHNKIAISERIADLLLEANILREEFLQIKFLCARVEGKRFSMLKYAKELFELTHEESVAGNIIALLFERNETDYNAYAPYISILSNSEQPTYCMTVASAMLRLGKLEEAEFYAYKALYYLNGKDNYEIYKSFFGYYSQNLNRYHEESSIKNVRGNTVVILRKMELAGGEPPIIIRICLDSESEFSDANNRSLDIEHVTRTDNIYNKLCGNSVNQIVNIRGSRYEIIEIHSRIKWAIGFVFQKIREHPEKFEGAIWVLYSNKPEELFEQIRKITDRTEQTEALLRKYHFEEGETGLPVDALIFGDYDRYVRALIYLLYGEDQAFYAGNPIYESEEGQRYVPALSTLVLLASLNLLNVLSAIKNDIVLPNSYLTFFTERYTQAKKIGNISLGRLVNIDNKFVIIENDTTEMDVWERIIDFCENCAVYNVSDDERIGFMIGDDMSGEQFFSAAQISSIHLDAFVLAAEEKMTFLCDDFFFRKLASFVNIRSINFVSILEHYVDADFVVPIILELSKTNYLYIPFMARTDEEAREIKKNVLTGRRKRMYYSAELKVYKMAYEKVMMEMLGEASDIDEDI